MYASLPALLVVASVTLVPILVGVGLSFTSYNLDIPDQTRFVGLANYAALPADPTLPTVLRTTVVFVVGMVGAETLTGLGLALLLARRLPGVSVFRILYMLPLMTAGIAVAISWRYLFNVEYGWVNYFLGVVGLPQPLWAAGPDSALPTLILADMWVGTPLMAILILAGLLALPSEPVEAAKVDGASSWQIFRHITLPAITPVLTVAMLFRTVDAFRKFELIQAMTAGGPGIRTAILNYYVYQVAFQFGRLGYGATLAIVLVAAMAVTLGLILFIGRIGRNEVGNAG